MAKKVELKDMTSGEVMHPVTSADFIAVGNSTLPQVYATKEYAAEAFAKMVNSSPEQLAVIKELGERLADDDDLANAVTNEIAEVKAKVTPIPQVFIDMWNQACVYGSETIGRYNKETGYFELNGITDLSYNEAIDIYANRPAKNVSENGICLISTACRTYFPISTNETIPYLSAYTYNGWAGNLAKPENTYSVYAFRSTNPNGLRVQSMNNAFYSCRLLKSVIGKIDISACTDFQSTKQIFYLCTYIHDFDFYGLKTSLNIPSNHVSLDSLNLLIRQALNTSPITITVHADVYAKLTDTGNTEWNKVLTDAADKQITFAQG